MSDTFNAPIHRYGCSLDEFFSLTHNDDLCPILGAFAKFGRATLSFVMSVCPSLSPSARNSGLQVGGFSLNWIFENFSIILEKIQVSLKSDENDRYFTRRPAYIYDHISLSFSSNEKISCISCRENKNSLLGSITFFFPKIVPFMR